MTEQKSADTTLKMGVTREKLKELLDQEKPNATYKKPAELSDYVALDIVKAVLQSVSTGQRFYLLGSAGIGKTSFVEWFVEKVLGYKMVYIPAAQISIENLIVPMPEKDEETGQVFLQPYFFDQLNSPEPKVIFIDEIGRADKSLGNTLMELLQEGTIAGREIPNLVTVLGADNPGGSQYGKMSALDFSQADRFATVVLSSKDTPWRRHLAAEFPNVDLSGVYQYYDTLGAEIREILNPRVLSFVISALLEGFPAIAALPMVNGERQMLIKKGETSDSEINKYTKMVLDRIATGLGVNNPTNVPDIVRKALRYSVTKGQNIYIQGPPGVGKTSFIKAHLRDLGVKAHYDSAAVLTPEDMSIPFPNKDKTGLDLVPMAKFSDPDPWIWILDEITRGSRRTQNALMEPIQQRTIGGIKTNIIATVALNNPREHNGMQLDVGKNDLAQASRFALSLSIQASDIPWTTYIFETYGEEVATPFIEFWQDDLDDLGRAYLTPRGIERMIDVWLANNNIQWALPYVGGDYVKVPLAELKARLAKRPMARLRKILAESDLYYDRLIGETGLGENEDPEAHSTVYLAFNKAELKQLEENKEAVGRIFAALSQQHKLGLVRLGGERQKFWHAMLMDTKKLKAEADAESKRRQAAAKA